MTDTTGTEGLGTSGQLYHHLRQLVADPPLNAGQGPPSTGSGFPASDYIGSVGLNLADLPAALVDCATMHNPQEAALTAVVSHSAGCAGLFHPP